MTTRKILAIIIALVLVLGMTVCLSGCSKRKESENIDSKTGGLVAIYKQDGFVKDLNMIQVILYDPDTSVMYCVIRTSTGTFMTMLYNADGTPKLYNPENN